MQKNCETNVRHVNFTSKQKHSSKKQIIKCKNHFSVFITNKLIIKTTKAAQSRAAIIYFIVRLTLMRQAYILIYIL